MGALEQPTTKESDLPRRKCRGSSSFGEQVLKWASQNKGDFPWRQSRSAYHILVAELLLKRTTATAAARVYEEFLDRFPSAQTVSSAPFEELVDAFSGVGLQRQRARDFKRLAEWLLTRFGGSIPKDLNSLLEVPGLGNYSAAAIMSFGHGFPLAVVDANVERILIRVFGNDLPPRPSGKLLDGFAQNLLPKDDHREYNYGLLDLGRTVCRYVDPKCGECPLASDCDYFVRTNEVRTDAATGSGPVGPPSRLRTVRRRRGLSLKRLAEIANVSKLTVIRIEAGRTSPRRETLEKLGRALNVSPEELSG